MNPPTYQEHDLAYSYRKDSEERHEADHILNSKAKERLFARTASLCEKTTAAAV